MRVEENDENVCCLFRADCYVVLSFHFVVVHGGTRRSGEHAIEGS